MPRKSKSKFPVVPVVALAALLLVAGLYYISRKREGGNLLSEDPAESGRFYPPAPTGSGSGGGFSVADLNALGVPTQSVSQGSTNATQTTTAPKKIGIQEILSAVEKPKAPSKNPPTRTTKLPDPFIVGHAVAD